MSFHDVYLGFNGHFEALKWCHGTKDDVTYDLGIYDWVFPEVSFLSVLNLICQTKSSPGLAEETGWMELHVGELGSNTFSVTSWGRVSKIKPRLKCRLVVTLSTLLQSI